MRLFLANALLLGLAFHAAGADLPATFDLSTGESRVFRFGAVEGEYMAVEIQSARATLNATLRLDQVVVAESASPGGTGGTIQLAAVADHNGSYQLEIRRTGKEPGKSSVTVAIAASSVPSPRDLTQARAFRALADAKTPDAMAAALQLAQQAENPKLVAQIAAAEARALFSAAKYQAGIDLARARIADAKNLPDPRLAAQLLYVEGLCELLLEKNREAAGHFAEALVFQRQAEQPYETAATLQNLSAAHMLLGECAGSLAESEEALAIRRTLGDEAREAFSLMGTAKAALCLGENQQALDSYNAVILLWRRLKDGKNEAASWNDMGVIYTSLGSWELARTAYQTALRLRESAQDNPGQAETLVNLGLLHLQMREWPQALASYDKALAVPRTDPDKRFTGYALEGRAEALFRLGRGNEASGPLRNSIDDLKEVGDRNGEAYSWRMLAEMEASVEDYRQAVSLSREAGDKPAEAVSLYGLAELQRGKDDFAGARASLEQALPIIETTRADLSNPGLRMSYLRVSRDAYELYVDVLSDLAAGADISFQASEQAHARTLLDEIGMRQSNTKTATLAEIRSGALDRDTVLLEYLLGDRHSWLWFVSQDSIERFELPPRAVLERLARQLYTDITSRDVRDPSETPEQRANRWKQADQRAAAEALRLRQAILSPVWNRLGRRRVILVNDGLLHLVPFGALGVEGEIVLAPSASVLVELRKTSAPMLPAGPMLLLADPVFDASKFAQLPLSRQEADKIVALVPRGLADERVGLQAVSAVAHSAAFSRAATIHIASHTILNSENPELSGVVLTQASPKDNPEDGFLRLRDIYKLRLNAGLVTLSGCETALGKDVRGEGMIGLSYAFLYAGARRAVASLWKVEDAATEEFMTAFYSGIYRKRLTPAASLRAAQAEMRLDPRWKAPYYWASFTIEGDWN